jgi:hypothetical protein
VLNGVKMRGTFPRPHRATALLDLCRAHADLGICRVRIADGVDCR